MARRFCPVCQYTLDRGAGLFCPACGFDLNAPPPPPGWVIGDVDLRKVARCQRRLLWYILAALATQCLLPSVLRGLSAVSSLPPLVSLLPAVIVLAVAIMIIVGVSNMLAALRTHIVLRILYVVLLLAPCVNLLALLSANGMATRALKRAGLRVGLMGVKDEQVVRFLSYNRCRKCGYSLIGNVSGRCPECGTPRGATSPDAQTDA